MMKNKFPATTAEFYEANKKRLFQFGEYFLEKLTDRELIDALAEKDLEKLARIYKLVFEKLEDTEDSPENPTLSAIISAVEQIGGEKTEQEE